MAERTADSTRVSKRATLGGMVGGIVEWYDFSLYGFMAVILSKLFFPLEDATSSLIATYGVFAVGFLMRPLGGLLFGYLGDRMGRKSVLLLSVLMMGTGVILIGILPTYQDWGIWASVCLVVIRMFQGLSAGGEVSGAVTYLVEAAPDGKRCFAASWATVGVVIGMLMGAGIPALVIWILGSEATADWGWRIPFLLGGVIGVIALLLRRHMPDPTSGEAEARTREGYRPMKRLFKEEPDVFARVIIYAACYGVLTYIPMVFLPTWVSLYTSIELHQVLFIVTMTFCVQAVVTPLHAALSDRIMRRTHYLAMVCLIFAVVAVPLFVLAGSGSIGATVVAFVIFVVVVAGNGGVAPTTFAEAFDRGHRMSGYSLSFNIGFGLAAGTAPMIATWLIALTGDHLAPAYYLVVFAIVGMVTILTLKDRSREALR